MRSIFLFFSISFFIFLFYISFASEIFAFNQKNSVPLQQLQNDSLIEVYSPDLIEDGFSQGTLVKTVSGYIPIEKLRVGDYVIDQHGQQQEVLAVTLKKVLKCWEVTVNHETFFCGIDQLFYDTSLDDWVLIYEIGIIETEIIEKPMGLYQLTVNGEVFSVSYAELLAHNHPAVMITAVPLVTSIIPAAAKAVGVLGVVGTALYSLFAKNKNSKRNKILSNQNSCSSPTPPKKPNDEDECRQKHPHGRYEDAGYHKNHISGRKSPRPIDGQTALDNSFDIPGKERTRIGFSQGQFVVLNETVEGVYHGHVRVWDELRPVMHKVY